MNMLLDFHWSDWSQFGETIDENFGKKKTRNKTRSRRRLRKSYQMSESDDDESSQQKYVVKAGTPFSELESLDEDNHPISSLCNNKTKGENAAAAEEKETREHKVLHESSDTKTEFDGDFVTGVNGNTDGTIEDGQLNGLVPTIQIVAYEINCQDDFYS